jgi:putative transposase
LFGYPSIVGRLLVGTIKADLETAIQEIAKKLEVTVVSLEVQPDHIHLFVSAPPRYSSANLINAFKGATSKRLRNKYPYLKSLPSMWTKTYYAGTACNLSAGVIKQYIEECQG